MVACRIIEQQHGRHRHCNTFINYNLFGNRIIRKLYRIANGYDNSNAFARSCACIL
jgi:hypothetical protein